MAAADALQFGVQGQLQQVVGQVGVAGQEARDGVGVIHGGRKADAAQAGRLASEIDRQSPAAREIAALTTEIEGLGIGRSAP